MWEESCLGMLRCLGEAIPKPLVQQYLCDLTLGLVRFKLMNTYGVTEACVYQTFFYFHPTLTATATQEVNNKIMGTPFEGVRIVIMDTAEGGGGEVAPGVEGEICVAGVQVARGYLHHPKLTAEKFAAQPSLGRMYRTGDLGRFDLTKQVFVLVGRQDFQVKIRGQRVELGICLGFL
jgi:non-ribosomal peptide synthetase component F